MNLRWSSLDRFSDFGLLVLRSGVGVLFAAHHGLPALIGGFYSWANLGRAIGYLGVHTAQAGWGFAAAFTMTVGGFCLALGWATRPAALALSLTMVVASIWKFYPFGGLQAAAYPLAMLVVCMGLLFTGPGKYSVDEHR